MICYCLSNFFPDEVIVRLFHRYLVIFLLLKVSVNFFLWKLSIVDVFPLNSHHKNAHSTLISCSFANSYFFFPTSFHCCSGIRISATILFLPISSYNSKFLSCTLLQCILVHIHLRSFCLWFSHNKPTFIASQFCFLFLALIS